MNSTETNRKFVVKQLDDALKKCERKNIPLETVVETIISFGVTLAITSRTPEDAAKLLEIMALAVRSGKITSPDIDTDRCRSAPPHRWRNSQNESHAM